LQWRGVSLAYAFSGTNAMLPRVSYASPYVSSCTEKHSSKENLFTKGACEARGNRVMPSRTVVSASHTYVPFSGGKTSTLVITSLTDFAFFGNRGNDSNRALQRGQYQT
jgi:hypothetical protein